MSQNKYITISMVLCLVLCGVLCFLGTPLLKVQAETIEYTENVKVRHNADYVPSNPVVVPVQYDNYNSYGTYDYNGLWGYVNGAFTLYDSNFNIWNENWDVGEISQETGLDITGTGVRCVDYISVIPNTNYVLTAPYRAYFYFYNSNYEFLGYSP